MITSLRNSAFISLNSSATTTATLAMMMTPTALRFAKFCTKPVYMNRMPSMLSRLRAAVVAGSILPVAGL